MGGKIKSRAPSSQIPMMLYCKALKGVSVGVVLQQLMRRVIGHCFQIWMTRIIPLHNLTSQEHRNMLN